MAKKDDAAIVLVVIVGIVVFVISAVVEFVLDNIISIGIIPIIIFLIPFHQFALIIFITFLTVYNVIIHLGFSVPLFSPFKYQNTSRNHDFHHFTSHGNYGLYFTFWDRMMGTYIK